MKIRFTVRNKLIIGFGTIILGVLISSILTYSTLDQNRKVSDDITKIHSPSVSLLTDLLSLVNDSKMLIKNWVFIDKKADTPDKIRLNELHEKDFPALKQKLIGVAENWTIEQQNLLFYALTSIEDTLFEKHRYIMNRLNDFESYEDVMVVFEVQPMVEEQGEVMIETGKVIDMLSELTRQQEQIVEDQLTQMDRSFNAFQFLIILMGILLLVVGALSAWLTTNSLVKPINYLKGIILQMGKGVLPKKEIKGGNDEMGEISEALNLLVSGLKDTSLFANEIGKGKFDIDYNPLSSDDSLGNALIQMRDNLRKLSEENEANNWLQTSIMKVSDVMRGEKTVRQLADKLLSVLAEILNMKIGAVYLAGGEEVLELSGSYAFDVRKDNTTKFKFGESLVGQAAMEQKPILFTDPPKDYIYIQSGLGKISPQNILVTPLVYQSKVIGVIEMGFAGPMTKLQMELINQVSESLAIGFNSIKTRTEIQHMLQMTTEQAEQLRIQQEELKHKNEEMQTQQEELRVANEELEEQTKALKKSEASLKEQQEELQVTNEELEEKTRALEEQKKKITDKNMELELARANIEQKAKELEISSKYKSEFLANMSHELRTPLNSLLILSRDLADNKTANLNDEQIESAEIIYKSGNDLLSLINEILDLSKIESGKMALNLEAVPLEEIKDSITRQFGPVVHQKQLKLDVDIDSNLPETIGTDKLRLEQILKNLISNAVKFTEEGGVRIHFHWPAPGVDLSRSGLDVESTIAISVIDSGIGIPKDKQIAIWEAFQQADGGTSRKYGGTGLGLSISRELAKLLGGEILLRSEVGKGSTFTLYIPLKKEPEPLEEAVPRRPSGRRKETGSNQEDQLVASPAPVKEGAAKPAEVFKTNPKVVPSAEHARTIPDDRDSIVKDDKVILIIEDDPSFVQTLINQARQKGFKCLASTTGEQGLKLAEQYIPDAIILDIKLPGIDGYAVLEKLKDNSKTRHIPVHVMSAYEETIDIFQKGAIGFLNKPAKPDDLRDAFGKIEHFIDRKMKDLLIVEDDESMRKSIRVVIGEEDVNITEVDSGEKAYDAIKNSEFDCMVLDLGLPDMTGFELLRKLDEDEQISIPPIIVYTGKELTKEENDELQNYTSSIIIKGVKSEERLLDETALFLHRVVDDLPDKKQKIIANLHDKEKLFQGKKIMVVDDDMRNVFALSKVLKGKGMEVVKAVNGQMALEVLEKQDGIDLVLMDIMMPVLDGYETTKKIREEKKYDKLPVIALTAKAMKEDRQKCIEAGANDYMSKPVNVEKLLSLMRVWLYK